MIDLRSDTLTRPSVQMLEAMYEAEVGDDVFGEDPTVNKLQDMIADLTGKEAALFVPSGTMGNQICINAHTQPGQEIIVERNSHIFNYECGSPAMLSGVQVMPLDGTQGHFTADQLQEVLRPANIHHPQTSLVCLENTHNRAGGTIFPIEEIEEIRHWANQNRLKMHLDGARLWNASVATGISIKKYCQYADSVSLCFSKGLGAPVGSVVAGNRKFINRARYYRKAYGGGMRQAGILAAAAIFAVKNNFERLREDHTRARQMATAFSEMPGIEIDPQTVQSNIVIFDVKKSGKSAEQVTTALSTAGIKMLAFAGTRIRAVTHLHITDEEIDHTIQAMKQIMK